MLRRLYQSNFVIYRRRLQFCIFAYHLWGLLFCLFVYHRRRLQYCIFVNQRGWRMYLYIQFYWLQAAQDNIGEMMTERGLCIPK